MLSLVKINDMTSKCIKDIKTKKGLIFTKGKSYQITLTQEAVRVFNDISSISIKKSLFNKYFN